MFCVRYRPGRLGQRKRMCGLGLGVGYVLDIMKSRWTWGLTDSQELRLGPSLEFVGRWWGYKILSVWLLL